MAYEQTNNISSLSSSLVMPMLAVQSKLDKKIRFRGSELMVQDPRPRAQGSGHTIPDSEFRVQGSGFRVQSSVFGVRVLWFSARGLRSDGI